MKKRFIAIVIASALVVLAFAGCSSSTISTQSADRDAYIGFWKLDSSTPLGFEAYLNLEDKDDVAELYLGDALYEGTWSAADGKASMTLDGSEPVSIFYTGEKLMLGNNDDTRMLFARSDIESAFQSSQEPGASGDEGAEGEEEEDGVEYVDEVIEDVEPVTVADDEVATIQVTGKGTDFTGDPCYRLSFTNKSDRTLYITAEDEFTVAGKVVNAGLGDIAEPGKTVEALMFFPADELGGGLDSLVDVNGTVNVEVDDTYEEVAAYPFHMD